jgi:hypothetical protein
VFSSVVTNEDRSLVRTALVGLVFFAALAMALAFASGAKANPIAGGNTALTLNKGVAKVLKQNKVRVAPVRPARVNGGAVRFPVTGGTLDPATAAGTVRHSGGLRFQVRKRKLVVRDFVVRTGKGNVLTAQVGKARVPLLSLDLGRARVNRPGLGITVRNVGVSLTGAAAAALNRTFDVRLFKRGLRLGSVVVTTRPSAVSLAAAGATELKVDPGTLGALGALEVAPAAIGPASLTGDTFSFPITGGVANASTFAGEIGHSGGITLTKDETVVRLSDFTINVDADPDLVATVGEGGPRVSILDLDLTNLEASVSGRNITLAGVQANLTPAAAGALSDAFGAPIPAGLTLGTATVNAVAR